MNDFISYPNTIDCKTYNLIKDTSDDINSLEKRINNDFAPRSSSSTFNVIYCYYFIEKKFSYPNGDSNILYIGESEGEKHQSSKSLGFRFAHCKQGTDNKINICLRHYYECGEKLAIDIYDLPLSLCRKAEELKLRKNFLEKYHAMPIADGASSTTKS